MDGKCTVCQRELAPLEQYGPPQAPLCLEHFYELQDGTLTLWQHRTKDGGFLLPPMFDGYTYVPTETLKERP